MANPLKIFNGLQLNFTIPSAGVTDTFLSADANGNVTGYTSIAVNRLVAQTPSRAAAFDSSGFLTASAVTATELGYVSGVTSSIQAQLNALGTGTTFTANRAIVSNGSGVLSAATTTLTEIGYVSGVTSAIQTQLNALQPLITGGATTIISSNLAVNLALVSDGSGKVNVSTVTATELGYVSGVTSSIQTQLGTKLTVSLGTPASGDFITFNGTNWINSPAGSGTLPTGGSANQVLRKNTSTNYDTSWHTVVAADLTDVTATAAQINILTGLTSTTTQLNYLSTSTSDIQSQINAKLQNVLSNGAIFVGNTSNLPSQLAVGTTGQVLAVVAGVPQWSTITGTGTVTSVAISGGSTGLTTSGGPITTNGTITFAGTLVVANGGTGLTATTVGGLHIGTSTSAFTNLTIGSNGQVLTSNGTTASWANPITGFSNPMTAVGDLILGGTSGAAGRLAIGANNSVLTSNGTTASWVVPTAFTLTNGNGTTANSTAVDLGGTFTAATTTLAAGVNVVLFTSTFLGTSYVFSRTNAVGASGSNTGGFNIGVSGTIAGADLVNNTGGIGNKLNFTPDASTRSFSAYYSAQNIKDGGFALTAYINGGISLNPTYQQSSGSFAQVYGVDYNPTITGTAPTLHLAWRNTFGQLLFGGTTITAGSVLADFQSTTLGVLLPRVTNVASVTTPVNGMVAYDAATNLFNFRQNGAWVNISTSSGFTNPMTTAGDLILGGAAGAAGRLGIGSNTFVLTSNGTTATWAAAASGFANPMTTVGDLIVGGVAGAAGRLAAGNAGYVLTSTGTSSAPSWQVNSAGFTNPMTSVGDLILGTTGGVAARLAIGSNGQVLSSNGTTATWATPSGGSSLTPTSIQTSAYTASAGNAVLTDARTGIIAITLPTAPTDKSQVSVKQLYLYTPYFTKILTGGSDILNTGTNIAYLYTAGQVLTFQYQSSTSTWYVTSAELSLSQIEGRSRNYGKINIPAFSTLYSFGSSITAGVPGPTSVATTYTELLSNALGSVKSNQGIGSTSASTASLTALSITGLNKNPITAELGINDLRSSISTPTYERIKGALRSILANQFLADNPLPANSGSIAQGGTWSTVTAHSIGEKASYIGGLALKATVSPSTLTFTSVGTSLVIGTFGVDGTTQAGGIFTVSVDGTVVYTFDNRALTNGTTDGAGNQGLITNNAIVLQQLSNTSHTIVITVTSLSTSGAVFIDYVGKLKNYSDCQGAIVTTIPKLDATGYSSGTASDIADDLGDANALQIINNEFYGFPIAFVDINKDFNPTTDLYTDHTHRNDSGNQKLARNILAAVNTNSPRISSEFVTHAQSQQTWDATYGVGYLGTNRNVQTGVFNDPTKGATVHYMVPSTAGGRHEWWTSNSPNTSPFASMKLMENSTLQLLEPTGTGISYLSEAPTGLSIFANRDPNTGISFNGTVASSGIALSSQNTDGAIYFFTTTVNNNVSPPLNMKLDKNGVLNLLSTSGLSQLQFPTSSVTGNSTGLLLYAGAHYNGSNYIADATSASMFVPYAISQTFDWYSNTGLTIGSSFTPTGVARLTNVGLYIGNVTNATAKLHLAAGSATAGTSPIKLTTGTALTTPEDGALEYQTSHLYFTIGSTRFQLDQQGGWSASGATTITAATSQTGAFTNTATFTSYIHTQSVQTGTVPAAFVINGGAHTALTASTEYVDFNINLARTIQFSTGALATERLVRIQAATLGFVGASTVTTASTVSISGPVNGGTNATITTSIGLNIEAAALTNVGTGYGSFHNAPTGATTNYALGTTGNSNFLGGVFIRPPAQSGTIGFGLFFQGANHTALTASIEIPDISLGGTRSVQFNTGALLLQRSIILAGPSYAFVGASTLTDAATMAIANSPIGGTNATITNSHSLLISAGTLTGTVTNSYGLTANAQSGATTNWAAQFIGNTKLVGNLIFSAVGNGWQIKEGTNARQGVSTLVAGTVTVSNTSITANTRIYLTAQETGSLTGFLKVTARSVGTSFTIGSSVGIDTAVISWFLVEGI